MPELEDSNGDVRRDEAHERWLAMQSAYAEYMRAATTPVNIRPGAAVLASIVSLVRTRMTVPAAIVPLFI